MAHRRTKLASYRYEDGILPSTSMPRTGHKAGSCCFNGCSQANLLRVREVAGLRLTELTYPPGLRLSQHSHEQSCFCFLLNGLYDITCSKQILLRKPGSLTFTASGKVHSNRIHSEEVRCFSIEMTRPWLERANGHLKFLQGPAQFDSGSLPWLAMRLYREFRLQDDLTPLAIEGLALELLAGAARQSVQAPENGPTSWLNKARDSLHERFREPLTLAGVAEFAGVHPVSLARAFRRTHHCTVGEYVRKLRIEFACQELTASDASLVEIAFSAGFSEQSHFCRTFKRFTGLTPSQYRSNSRLG
jgi:AraC family transcriptional regulator